MAKAKSNYPEIDEIKGDIASLKSNVVELTRHMQENGADKTHEMAQTARKRLAALQKTGKQELQKMEKQVKAKPAQSLAVAFAAGLVTSFLLSRGR